MSPQNGKIATSLAPSAVAATFSNNQKDKSLAPRTNLWLAELNRRVTKAESFHTRLRFMTPPIGKE
ncbi:hypothetical protein F2Q68_00006909 [Brassica cretica]|uniref:Uncharacterized protein n=1 Tax=Brassica cretica TaxID=69181 RepID=A0A8S9JP41_BRACR|nr:hypothetical protein F2Q68_00006909 [Brassica cretica]